jgi:hypothetical protein
MKFDLFFMVKSMQFNIIKISTIKIVLLPGILLFLPGFFLTANNKII